jgi:hypothetical protein
VTPKQISYGSAREAIDELAQLSPALAAAIRTVLDEPGCGGECCEDWEAGCNAGIALAAKAAADALRPAPPID